MKTLLIRVLFGACLCGLAVCWCGVAAAADKDWSSWMNAEGDDAIQFRFKVTTYGVGLAPDCTLQVRNNFAKIDGVVAYIVVERVAGPEQIKRTIFLDRQDQKGGDAVSDCKTIRKFSVAKARRR